MPVTTLSQVERNKSRVCFDALGAVSGIDLNTSLEVAAPDMLFVEGLLAGTTMSIQVRPSSSAVWYELKLVDGALTPDAIIYLNGKFNFVRTVRVGVANTKVFAQDAYHV